MAFMKKGTAMTPARQVGMKEWGLTKTAAVADQEEQARKAAEAAAQQVK